MNDKPEAIHINRWQHNNVMEARFKMWPTISRHQVNLDGWSTAHNPTRRAPECNTTACFGGWCAWWPAFRALGVVADHRGAPVLYRGEGIGRHFFIFVSGMQLADHLFGWRDLFESRGDCPCDPPSSGTEGYEYENSMSDYDMVTARLDWLLANCIVVD